jgi:hypothetical protein
MDEKEASQELVSDEEKRQALVAVQRKFAARLGVNPDLLEEKISFGLQSVFSPERQGELAMAKGLQLGMQMALPSLLEELQPRIQTREQLDELVQAMDAELERAPTTVRDRLDQIKKGLPRRGGPGRDPLLDERETKMLCKEILKRVGKKYTATKAIAEVSKMCPDLIGKTVSTGTLWKAWEARNEHDLESA